MAEKKDVGSHPILVPIDFSEDSEHVVLWAADVADAFGAPLLVLHVVHDPASAPGYYQRAKKPKKQLRRNEEAAEEIMSEFLADLRKKHPKASRLKALRTKLAVGLPVTRILEIAEKTQARMIVMGSRGRTGLSHLLLGSKAERVIQFSPIPVTIVKKTRA